MLRTKSPLLLAGLLVIVILTGAAIALAMDSNDDPPEATPTATSTATATPTTPTSTPLSPTVTPVPPTPTVITTETWSIEFQRTGGFAGLAQSLSVSSNGQVIYRDMRVERTESGTLTPSDLTELRALIDDSIFFSQPALQEAPCADCFNLSITVTLDGATHTVQAVDIGLEPALRPFVEKLVTLLQDGLVP